MIEVKIIENLKLIKKMKRYNLKKKVTKDIAKDGQRIIAVRGGDTFLNLK